MDVKDIILAASIAKGAGGGSGGVTKEYVDNQVGAVSERVDDVEDVIPFAATPQNQLATTADVSETAIASTSTTSPITDSADGMAQGLTIYGRSEVVDGEIKSVGDDGLTVETCGKNLFGGLEFAEKLNAVSNESIIDTNNKTVSFDHYASTESNTLWVNNTQKKQFTIITTGQVPNEGNVNNSLNIEYDDGTTVSIAYFYTLVKTTKIFITDANKTVKRIFLDWGRGNLATLYYDECGVFEGVKTESDFEPYNGTMATFTTALPLRSTLDGATRDELIIGKGKAEIITRCEVVDDNIVPLATPVTTPLTDAEIAAFRGLRTYDSTTNVTISNEPDFEIDYLKNTDNGQAVADIQTDLQGQINKITSQFNRQVTLSASDWVGNDAPYVLAATVTDMTADIVPIIGLIVSPVTETGNEQIKQWGYISRAVSGENSITFYCYKNKPTIELTANVKVV